MSLASTITTARNVFRRIGQSALSPDEIIPEAGANAARAEVMSSGAVKESDSTVLIAEDEPEDRKYNHFGQLSRPYTEDDIRELAARAALTGRPLDEVL